MRGDVVIVCGDGNLPVPVGMSDFLLETLIFVLQTFEMNASVTVPDLLDKASHLNNSEFESFFNEMLTLRAKRVAPVLSQKEADLLDKIYAKLPPATQERYDSLTEKRRDGAISTEEYGELLALVQVVEQYNVERLKLIVELAALRKVTAQQLMKQLGLMPLHNG